MGSMVAQGEGVIWGGRSVEEGYEAKPAAEGEKGGTVGRWGGVRRRLAAGVSDTVIAEHARDCAEGSW